jgi:hypothetical protein
VLPMTDRQVTEEAHDGRLNTALMDLRPSPYGFGARREFPAGEPAEPDPDGDGAGNRRAGRRWPTSSAASGTWRPGHRPQHDLPAAAADPGRPVQSRWERLAVLEAHSAQAAGSLTEHARRKVGRCSAPPGAVRSAERTRGELVCLDAFYMGKLKGVGRVWQPVLADKAGIHWLRCGLLLQHRPSQPGVLGRCHGSLPDLSRGARLPPSRWASPTGSDRSRQRDPRPVRPSLPPHWGSALPAPNLGMPGQVVSSSGCMRLSCKRFGVSSPPWQSDGVPPALLRRSHASADRARSLSRLSQSPSRPSGLPYRRPNPQ